MLLALAAAAAAPDAVTLGVGVHREAGTAWDIAADGAAGQCTATDVALSCPATGPVTFRWGGDPRWVLRGDVVLAPGEVGEAWVLVDDALRVEQVARLDPASVTAEDVADLFARTGAHAIEPPSRSTIDALLALSDHPDVRVRREVVSVVIPLLRHTASDPFPHGSPPIAPEGWITEVANDPDPRVRRRLASRLRDLPSPGQPGSDEATRALLSLVSQGGSVQRAAMASLGVRSHIDDRSALETWTVAMERVASPGPPGRAAANTLAHLAEVLDPGPDVDPVEAVHRVYAHHRERTWRVWSAWRRHVPFDERLAEGLLRETIGFSPTLVRAWSREAPDRFLELLGDWEPGPPHSERYQAIVAATDNLSPGGEAPGVR